MTLSEGHDSKVQGGRSQGKRGILPEAAAGGAGGAGGAVPFAGAGGAGGAPEGPAGGDGGAATEEAALLFAPESMPARGFAARAWGLNEYQL